MSNNVLQWQGRLKELGSISLAELTCIGAYFRRAFWPITKTFVTDRPFSLCVDTPDESDSYPPTSQSDFYQPLAITRPPGGGDDVYIAPDHVTPVAAD